MHNHEHVNGFGRLASAVAAAGLVGIGWWLDARSRDRWSARIHRALVDLLLNALNAGDAVTERHSRRVADLADALFETYRLTRKQRATLRIAALLHDMGKIDDRFFHILHSYGALSDSDRARIEEHPHESADILEPLESIHPGLTATVEAHHECWNGKGYPRGLSGEEIPLGARMISVADVFDALTQPRAYREPLSPKAAFAEIRKGLGSRFDPAVVKHLEDPAVRRRWIEIANRGRAEEERWRRSSEVEASADHGP